MSDDTSTPADRIAPALHAELQRYWLGAIDAKLAEGHDIRAVVGTMVEIGIAGLLTQDGPMATAERLTAGAVRAREMAADLQRAKAAPRH